MFKAKLGYTEELGDMVYDTLLNNPSSIGKNYRLLDARTTKDRLRFLMPWIYGIYKDNRPIACFFGANNDPQDIQFVSSGQRLTKGMIKQFHDWFFSMYNECRAEAIRGSVAKILTAYGFTRQGNAMKKAME